MSFICYFCPEFISLWMYLNKLKNKKDINLLKVICYYFLSVLFVNFIILVITHVFFKTYIYYFTVSFSIKYIILASFLSLFSYFLFKKLDSSIEYIKPYKLFVGGINVAGFKRFYHDNLKKINVCLFVFLSFFLFFFIDIYVRSEAYNVISFYDIFKLSPNLFTLFYFLIFLLLMYYLPKNLSKVLFIVINCINFFLFFIQYMFLNIKKEAFSVYDLFNASEGFEYLNFLIGEINVFLILFTIVFIGLVILGYIVLGRLKSGQKAVIVRWKVLLVMVLLLIGIRLSALYFLGSYEDDSWEKVSVPKYYYDNSLNYKKSLSVSGLYEYTFRDVFLYFSVINASYGSVSEIDELISKYNVDYEKNDMTGIFKDKNLIMIMLESIDNVVVNDKTMPTLYYMLNNGWNFPKRYSSLSSGGSTLITEYSSISGLFYPMQYNKLEKIAYDYSIPSQFANIGYKVNSAHENHGMYYNREVLHASLGFQNSYFLYDILDNPNYYDDSQMVLNDEIYNSIVSKEERFFTFIVTIAAHGPYTNNWVCDEYKNGMSEKECLEYLAGKTDYFLQVLLERLEKDNLLDDTVIVFYTDHQAYSYDYTIDEINSLTKIDDNYNIRAIPFGIYSTGIDSYTYDDILVNDVDLAPTIMNLFGIEYDPNLYIGTDLFSKNHKNLIMFSDYSWYDGNIYSGNANVSNISSYYIDTSNYVFDKMSLSKMIVYNDYYRKLRK